MINRRFRTFFGVLLLALGFQAASQHALFAANPPFLVYGYLGDWDTVTLASLPWNSLTHVMDAFGIPNSNGTFSKTPRAGLVTTGHSNGKRILLSIGGASASTANWSSSTAVGTVDTFVANIMNFVATNNYDGVDIDWEFPNANNAVPSDNAKFTALMQKLYSALTNSGDVNWKGLASDGGVRELTFFVSPGYNICGVDWNNVGNY